MQKINITKAVSLAIEDRAEWLYFLYKEMKKNSGKQKAEELARKAIRKFGHFKAKKKGKTETPKKWVKKHTKSISGFVFKSEAIKANKEIGELHLHYCPLVNAWKKLRATKKEIALLCDIAMDGDRGRAEAEGLKIEVSKTIGKGDKFCCLIFKK